MTENTDDIDEIINTLIDIHLKLASITSGLLFACRTANHNNRDVNEELDTTASRIDEYIETISKAINEFKGRRKDVGRT